MGNGKTTKTTRSTNRSGCSRTGSHGPLGRAYGKSVGLGCRGCFYVLCGVGGYAATTEAVSASGRIAAQSRGRPSPSACEQVRAAEKGLSPRLRRRPLPHGHESPPAAGHEKEGRGNREQGTGNGEWGTGNGERGSFREFSCPREAGFSCPLEAAAMQRIAGADVDADRACTGMRRCRAGGRQRRPAATKDFVFARSARPGRSPALPRRCGAGFNAEAQRSREGRGWF